MRGPARAMSSRHTERAMAAVCDRENVVAKNPRLPLSRPLLGPLERRTSLLLDGHPQFRNALKTCWQLAWSKLTTTTDIRPLQATIYRDSFFGFHDKSPWSHCNSHIAGHHTPGFKRQSTSDAIQLGYATCDSAPRFEIVASTRAWNWQQGSQLQWLPGSARLIFNDIDGKHCPICRIVCISSLTTTEVAARHIAAIHPDGTKAVTIDFQQLGRAMPGYGYSGLATKSARSSGAHSAQPVIEELDLRNGRSRPLITLDRLTQARAAKSTADSHQAFSHCSYDPDGLRLAFFFLARVRSRLHISLWSYEFLSEKLERIDVGYPSHYCWGPGGSLFVTHRTSQLEWLCESFSTALSTAAKTTFHLRYGDGHPSYSPTREALLVDTYPDRSRVQRLVLFSAQSGSQTLVAATTIPISFRGSKRCDFHPRWRHDGKAFCIDAVIDGRRSMLTAST